MKLNKEFLKEEIQMANKNFMSFLATRETTNAGWGVGKEEPFIPNSLLGWMQTGTTTTEISLEVSQEAKVSWGDGSVEKVLTAQAWVSEFDPQI